MTSVARFALLVAVLDDPGWAILDLIDPAPWTVNKTETVDPTSIFGGLSMHPTAFDEDRLIEISTDTDPGALMQVVRVWDQDLAVEISPELIFAATTRRMGPVED